jgi:hypothetical protein
MLDTAKEFHQESLKEAAGEFFETDNVLPRFTVVRHRTICTVMTFDQREFNMWQTFCEIDGEYEPDVVNFRALASPQSEETESHLENVLFAMTYDHFGDSLFSVYEMHKDRYSVDLKDSIPKSPGAKLELRIGQNILEIGGPKRKKLSQKDQSVAPADS